MDWSILSDYVILVVVGICMCIGYVLKTSLDFLPNKYIPLIMLCLGTVINILLNLSNITADVILGGMVSGLTSTGLHQMVHQMRKETDIINEGLKEKQIK